MTAFIAISFLFNHIIALALKIMNQGTGLMFSNLLDGLGLAIKYQKAGSFLLK